MKKQKKQKRHEQVLILMCGLARCGKSTWIKKNQKNSIIVCPDEIRSRILGHQFHKEAEDFIWAIAKAMTRLLLDQGKDVIIDATNINYFSRGCWIKIAREYGIKTKIIWIKTSIEACKNRNAKSRGGQKLPDGVIDRMAAMFEDPEPSKENNVEVIEIPKRRCNKKWDPFSNYYQDEIFKEGVQKNGKANKDNKVA